MNHKPFPFEMLPAELRELVYSHLLSTTKIQIRLVLTKEMEHFHSPKVIITGRDAINSQQYQITPAILRTSKQIYKETLPVLYSKNVFSFTSITSLRQFTRDVKTNIKLLRHVEIATTGRFALWEPMNSLLRAEGLRSLMISIGPDDVKERGWSDLVQEVTDFVVRKAVTPERRRSVLGMIEFVVSGKWEASGSDLYRSVGSEGAAEQVRRRVERRLGMMGCLSG